jgi:acetate kinase
MQILTITPTLRNLAVSAFRDGTDEPALQQHVNTDGAAFDFEGAASDAFSSISSMLEEAGMFPPDVVAIRGLYGGDKFTQPVIASESVMADLADLAPQAPLHVPHLVRLVQATRRTFPQAPLVLAFETAFFVPLPERERRYAIDPELLDSRSLRRFGFHGIFHEAACMEAARELELPDSRVLSICLEPRPELAACRGGQPVMVTGGSTPAEGLPGETSCGDLDPSVVLKLADDGHLGPEGASRLLTCQSGLLGLTGRNVSLAEVLASADDELQLARDVFLHCLLRACGAGIAALGGLDAIVYTGRYANSAAVLHEWLNERLKQTTQRDTTSLVHSRTLAQQLRDIAYVMVREDRVGAEVG